MDNFEFMSPTKFILEKDADKLCGREVKKFSDKVLFVHYGDQPLYVIFRFSRDLCFW